MNSCRRNYSRGETIQRRKLFAEIRYSFLEVGVRQLFKAGSLLYYCTLSWLLRGVSSNWFHWTPWFKGENYSNNFLLVFLVSLELVNTLQFHVIQLRQIDFCCLRLLQLRNIAKIRLILTLFGYWCVLSSFKPLKMYFVATIILGGEIIQGRKLYEEIRYTTIFMQMLVKLY